MVRSSAGNFYNYFSPGLGELIRSSEGRVAPPPSIFFFAPRVFSPRGSSSSLPVPCSIVSPFQPIFSYSFCSSPNAHFFLLLLLLLFRRSTSPQPKHLHLRESSKRISLFWQLSFDTCWRKPTATQPFQLSFLYWSKLGISRLRWNYFFLKVKIFCVVKSICRWI